jgi:hypothetical protein
VHRRRISALPVKAEQVTTLRDGLCLYGII